MTAIRKGQKETTNAAERTAVLIADKMLIVTLEGLLGFVRISNLVIRLTVAVSGAQSASAPVRG